MTTLRNSAPGDARFALRFGRTVVLAATVLASGCAAMKRDHVTVGSVPEDYRTNHPITLAEREAVLDLPADSGDLTKGEIATISGFLRGYDVNSGNVIRIVSPAGSSNEAAALRKASAITAALVNAGVNRGAVLNSAYSVADANVKAPLRIAYFRLTADTANCGRWPEDIANTSENKHYANFGCAFQKNLAAQLANPTDILGPRKVAPIDAGRRGAVLGEWQAGEGPFTETLEY